MEDNIDKDYEPKSSIEPYQKNTQSQQAFNKSYDQCQIKAILIFLGFKFTPIILYSIILRFRYLIFKFGTNQYLSTFILISLLVSADFWNTKNISGRQLAALRWYSKLNEDNQQKWCFQSSQVRVPAAINVLIFWLGQFIPIIFWLTIFLINIVTLSPFWVFLALFCCVLLISNFGLFLECKGDHQKRVNGITKRLGIEFFELNQEHEEKP